MCNLQVQKGHKLQSERKEFTSWLMTNNEPLKSESKQRFKVPISDVQSEHFCSDILVM